MSWRTSSLLTLKHVLLTRWIRSGDRVPGIARLWLLERLLLSLSLWLYRSVTHRVFPFSVLVPLKFTLVLLESWPFWWWTENSSHSPGVMVQAWPGPGLGIPLWLHRVPEGCRWRPAPRSLSQAVDVHTVCSEHTGLQVGCYLTPPWLRHLLSLACFRYIKLPGELSLSQESAWSSLPGSFLCDGPLSAWVTAAAAAAERGTLLVSASALRSVHRASLDSADRLQASVLTHVLANRKESALQHY